MNPLRQTWLNQVAASPLLTPRLRSVALRVAGVDARRAGVFPHTKFVSGHQVSLGEAAFVNAGVLFDARAPIRLGPRVSVGPYAMFITSTHPLGPSSFRGGAGTIEAAPIVVEEGCWIGAGAIILPGVTVGQGCVIGAGAVVTRDCDPDGLYVGAPARRVRELGIDGALP